MPKRQPHQAITSSVYSTLTPPVALTPTESSLLHLHHNELLLRAPSKVALFHQQPLQTYGTSANRASTARKTIARPNYKEICPQQVSLVPVRKTTINFSNAPHVAPIQVTSNNSQIGDTKSEKVLPATAAKSIVVLPWKVSKQSNASGETSASKQ
uniref:Uncharacterized protein n=1 Tax=Oryza punctata TaxID=4537 RepID=A0A0E0L111_ORYPU